jgi:rhodanese-related sulfurtransferase
MGMFLIVIFAGIVGLVIVGVVVAVRRRNRRELEQHSIEPEALYALMEAKKDVLILDVRQPLDLLAYSEIIPGAKRIPPKEVIRDPSLIPVDEDAIVYCTCNDEKTSRDILRRARALNFTRLKLLKGGLAAWKEKGYPVMKYEQPFHLDTAV